MSINEKLDQVAESWRRFEQLILLKYSTVYLDRPGKLSLLRYGKERRIVFNDKPFECVAAEDKSTMLKDCPVFLEALISRHIEILDELEEGHRILEVTLVRI